MYQATFLGLLAITIVSLGVNGQRGVQRGPIVNRGGTGGDG
jgi:hypothetical protein